MMSNNDIAGIVKHKQFIQAKKVIAECHKTSGTEFPRGVMIVGQSFLGKTTLGLSYLKEYPIVQTEVGIRMPVLFVSLPAKVSISTFFFYILKALRIPNPKKSGNDEMREEVYSLIENLQVELIIIDEIHRVIPEKSYLKTQDMACEIRDLQDKTHCPIVLIGIEKSLRLLDDESKGSVAEVQLINRLRTTIKMAPFLLEDKEWAKVLKTFNEIHQPAINFLDELMSNRLWLASQGSIGTLTELLRVAKDLSTTDQINLDCLSKAFMVIKSHTISYNPFNLTKYRVEQFTKEVTE